MNILIAAVGGQGALLTARIIGRYAESQGQQVKVSEIHGMSQRGGSVVTHVRYGEQVHSPVIELGHADVLLGFEVLEAARSLPYLRDGGALIVARHQIQPLPVLTGAAEYPSGLMESFEAMPISVYAIEAPAILPGIGNPKALNTLLIGVLARRLSQDPRAWLAAVMGSVPEKHRGLNQRAFEMGWNMDYSHIDNRRNQQKEASA
jgi:indolepyruvate ferredoxin oxidoreductase, beta subunit